MKHLITVTSLGFLVAGTMAFAATSKIVGIDSLKVGADEAAQEISGDTCELTVTQTSKGLKLNLTSENEKIELNVGADEQIAFNEVDQNDELIDTYNTQNGSLVVTSASDAFLSVDLTANGKTVNCEIDF